MNILLLFCITTFNLGNNQVDIMNDDYSAQIRFYNQRTGIIKQLIVDNIYGYKIAPEGKYLYVLNNEGINIYNDKGRLLKRINDKGMFSVSPGDKYLACASEDIVRVYQGKNPAFDIKVISKAIRELVFDNDNKYLGVMARNNFSLVSLNDKYVLWTEDFSEPLIFSKITDDKIVLVAENHSQLTGKVYIFSLTGEMLEERNFQYQQYDEQIQNIDLLPVGIKAKTHLREWTLGQAEQQFYEAESSPNYPIFLQDTIPWPLPPTNIRHCLGNNWFEYQNYGGSPYFHPGIDIITPGDSGVAVHAVKRGIVKAWLSTGGTWYWRFGIADSALSYTDSCNGYLYAHIDSARYHKNVGDTVNIGDLIGYLVPWPVEGFNHCHFAKIRDVGSTWTTADWAFVYNPLLLVQPNYDTVPPTFLNAVTNQKFAFARNNASTYISSSNLNGDIDIVARIYDKIGVSTGDTMWDRLIPLKIEYEIRGQDSSIARKLSFIFSGVIPTSTSLVNVVYKQDNTCHTYGDYDIRNYFFIVTNTDGDSILETSDANACWHTTTFPNGNYWVKVYAYDVSNVSICSMQVTVNNGGGINDDQHITQNSFDKKVNGFYNAMGQKINSLNPSQIRPGVYFYQNNNRIHKLLIIKPNIYFLN
jgi:murein DD-endopeptidase MepM/ murein hydrolase activator NlpD